MDESTSALDTRNEAAMYAALQRAGITFVSVGHRPSLAAFHGAQLKLQVGRLWDILSLSRLAMKEFTSLLVVSG